MNKHITDLNNREVDLVRWTNAYQAKKALQCPTTSFDSKKAWYVSALASLNTIGYHEPPQAREFEWKTSLSNYRPNRCINSYSKLEQYKRDLVPSSWDSINRWEDCTQVNLPEPNFVPYGCLLCTQLNAVLKQKPNPFDTPEY